MISKQVDTCRRYSPVPISFLIHAANSFDCDIYVKCEDNHVNVKSYDEMQSNLKTRSKTLLFYFDGADELAAQQKISRIFED